MKKLISVILLCAMLASTLASCALNLGQTDPSLYSQDGNAENAAFTSEPAWDGSTSDTSWYSASATSFTISDGADLKGLITLISQGTTFEGKTVKLANDINLGSKAWSIPSSSYYFKGTFDGDGHTIGGFKMTAKTSNQSLLGSIGGSAVVKNLTVDCGTNNKISLSASSSSTAVAGVVARVVTETGKTATIENVTAKCIISHTGGSSYAYVGGIVGLVEGTGEVVIKNCSNQHSVAGSQKIGGIVGGVKKGVTGITITDCENQSTITIIDTSTYGQAAGILGSVEMTGGSVVVTGCKNSGKITYAGSTGGCWLGGILGYVYGSSGSQIDTVVVKNCHSTGDIQANRTSGGLVGFFQRIKSLTVEDCSVNANLTFNIRSTTNFYVGGLIGMLHTNQTTTPAVIKNCTVSGTLTLVDPEEKAVYVGGIFGGIRTSKIEATDCHVDLAFAKEQCEADDTVNVVLGRNENDSAIFTPTNLTYNFHNLVAVPEDYVGFSVDSTIFKPAGYQYRYNKDSNTYDLRYVFGMDNLQDVEKYIGFEATLKKLDIEVTTSTTITYSTQIHTNLTSDGKTYQPSDFYSEYFCTYTISNIPASEIDLVEKDGTTHACLKNVLLTLTPFSQVGADAELNKGVGISEYAPVSPERHTFELQDFWAYLPDAFANAKGVISSYNISYNPAANLDCQEAIKMGKVNDQYILKKTCKCTGECTCGWGATGAVAYKKNENVPYHYYIDLVTYKSSVYFGEELDRYEAYHTWTFEVEEDGYYDFCFRIRLNGNDGAKQTRYALVQFDDEGYVNQTEFYYYVRAYDGTLRDNADNHDSYITGYSRYLTKGTHTITFRQPYDGKDGTDKTVSFHIRDIYMVKDAKAPANAEIPIPAGATLYDGNFDTSTCTYVLDNTTKTIFDNYRTELVKAGFVLQNEKVTDYQYSSFDTDNYNKNNGTMHNYFYTYTNADYMVYTYFCEGDGGMRVVVSDIEEYEKYVEVNEKESKAYTTVTTPLFAILDIGGPNAGSIKGVANGMCLVFRLSDGRFVIVDGGNWQENDTDGQMVKRLYDWLAQNADYDNDGNYTNNQITIAAWIFTHHHSDHISVGWKFNEMYQGKGKVEIQNYLYNFPDYEFASSVPGSNLSESYYTKWFPKMNDMLRKSNSLVAHTGFGYQFADMSIEILYTHEDRFPGSISSFNNSNTVYKITLAGKTFLIAGDLEEPGQLDCIKMTGTLLEADFLQTTHHGSNGQIEFYKYIVGTDSSGNFNTDTEIIWPLPQGENESLFNGTSARAEANRWLREMFESKGQIHYAVENWTFTNFK